MFDDFLKRASQLYETREAFAVATVVRCEAPTSGKPGDRAIITADGKLSGWIGGGCAQPVVIREALQALKDGKPRLVRVSPTAGAEPVDGITGYTMMCHSGGTLDIYIEPVMPKPHLLIFGRSPAAITLAALAKVLSYRVSVIAPEESLGDFPSVDLMLSQFNENAVHVSPITCIVVATQGEDDEGAMEQALKLEDASYVAFVASKKKWSAVSDYLRERGIDDRKLADVRAPAGLEIGAATPEEIAVSILAQVIQVQRKEPMTEKPQLKVIEPQTSRDPVCGMTVNVGTAKYVTEHAGKKIYFCCAPCKSTFDKDPAQFTTAP